MNYRQLTEGQRYQISLLLSQHFSLRKIARKLGVVPSTISREVRRNRLNKGCYLPNTVQKRTLQRRHGRKKGRITQDIRIAVEFMLELD